MAFADYLDLRTAVIEDVGTAEIADVFPRLTLLAEAYLNRNLRTNDQISEVTLTFTDGVADVPDDYMEAVGLFDASGVEIIAQTPQIAKRDRCIYAVRGNELHSDGLDGERFFAYYAKIPTITGSMTASNWLLEKYPDAYYNAVAYEAARKTRDLELAATFRVLRQESVDAVDLADAVYRYGRSRLRAGRDTP